MATMTPTPRAGAPERSMAYGECRVYGPDGVTLVRTISAATLRALAEKRERTLATQIAPRVDWQIPTVARLRKASLSLTSRNKARRRAG